MAHDYEYGNAWYDARKLDRTAHYAAATVAQILINAPAHHPGWDQYLLYVVELSERPGYPVAYHEFADSTHELGVMALNPDHPQTVETLADYDRGRGEGKLPVLQPPSLVLQFIATDEEMEELARLAARAIVDGALPAEKMLGYESHRELWLTSLTKTLAHLREEEHAP